MCQSAECVKREVEAGVGGVYGTFCVCVFEGCGGQVVGGGGKENLAGCFNARVWNGRVCIGEVFD